ncbi:hypothetical protein LJ601_002189 [Acinetobacter baumannii]|nr:hypothetical protein [Acinetobacter baumannii]
MKIGYAAGSMQDQFFLLEIEKLNSIGIEKILVDDILELNDFLSREKLDLLFEILKSEDDVFIPGFERFCFSELEFIKLFKKFSATGAKLHFVQEEIVIGGNELSYETAIKMFASWAGFLIKRENIKKDCLLGGSEKKAKGRKILLSKAQKIEALERFHLHGVKLKELESYYGVSRTTLWRAITDNSIEHERNKILKKKYALEIEKLNV